MTDLHVTTSHLGDLLGTLAHPHRLLLVMALAEGPCDATKLRLAMGTSQLGMNEHLRVLRAHHIVAERRDGAQVLYELAWPGILPWLGEALSFMQAHQAQTPGRMLDRSPAGGTTPAAKTS